MGLCDDDHRDQLCHALHLALFDNQLTWFPLRLGIAIVGAFLIVGRAHRRYGKRDTAIAAILASAAIGFIYATRNIGLWPELGSSTAMWLLLAFRPRRRPSPKSPPPSRPHRWSPKSWSRMKAERGGAQQRCFFAGYLMVQKLGLALGLLLVGQLAAYVGLGGKVDPATFAPAPRRRWDGCSRCCQSCWRWRRLFLRWWYKIDRADHGL